MLVNCQKCGVQFAFELRNCLSCGERYQIQPKDYETVVAPRVADWMKAKNSKDQIRDLLRDTFAIAETDIDEIERLARLRVRESHREHGGKIAGSGCILTFISAAIFLVSGGIFFAWGAAAVGIAMVVGGTLMRLTGWNLAGNLED